MDGRKRQEKKTGHHTRTWNSEIGKPLEQRDEKRVEEFLPSLKRIMDMDAYIKV
jgi:hypothetical protein